MTITSDFSFGSEPSNTPTTFAASAFHLPLNYLQDTILPSMELAIEDHSGLIGACDRDYGCIYMNTLSWRTPTTPMPMEINPRKVFERMFGHGGSAADRQARNQQERSMLDAIRQLRRLSSRERHVVCPAAARHAGDDLGGDFGDQVSGRDVIQEGERREIFLRYLGEVATAVAAIKDYGDRPRNELYSRLVDVAKRKTAVADTHIDDRGRKVEQAEEDFGDNVMIVDETVQE